MRLARISASLLTALAIFIGAASVVRAQAKPATKAAPAKPATKTTPAATSAKAAPKKHAKTAKAATPQAAAPAPASEEKKPEVEAKRDPFVSLLNVSKGSGAHLPPGKAGLVISTVNVDGAVRSQGGMIAVVSNPEQRVYFVREGDQLYDGDVEKITLEGVTFRERSKDAFGRPVDRTVTKRIYAIAGEQQ